VKSSPENNQKRFGKQVSFKSLMEHKGRDRQTWLRNHAQMPQSGFDVTR